MPIFSPSNKSPSWGVFIYQLLISTIVCWGKKGQKIHKICIFTEGEATFNILMMAVGCDITIAFCTLKMSFFAKILLCLWLAGHICVSSLFLLQSFHAALKRHGFLHVFILQTEPAHYAIIPVCQLVAIQKSTKAAGRRENIKLGSLR